MMSKERVKDCIAFVAGYRVISLKSLDVNGDSPGNRAPNDELCSKTAS